MSKYLIVKGKGGLGNRILSVLSGILYAEASGRVLVVDWRDQMYSDGQENVFYKLFSRPEPQGEVLQEGATIRPAVWTGRLDQSVTQLLDEIDPSRLGSFSAFRRYSVDVRAKHYPEDVLVMWSYRDQTVALRKYLDDVGWGLAAAPRFEILKGTSRRSLQVNTEIVQLAEAFIRNSWPRDVIGVHVRYTDMKVPLQRYIRAIDRCLKALPGASIFLATDNPIVEAVFARRYGSVIVSPKRFPAGGVPMHASNDGRDKVVHALEALTDIYLLSKCGKLVYSSRSTFSYVAHLMSDLKPRDVVDIDSGNAFLWTKRLAQDAIMRWF